MACIHGGHICIKITGISIQICTYLLRTEICTVEVLTHKCRIQLSRAYVQLAETEGFVFLHALLTPCHHHIFSVLFSLCTVVFLNSITLFKLAHSITCDPMPVAVSQKQVNTYRELAVTWSGTNTIKVSL